MAARQAGTADSEMPLLAHRYRAADRTQSDQRFNTAACAVQVRFSLFLLCDGLLLSNNCV